MSTEHDEMQGGEPVYRATDPEALRFDAGEDDASPVIVGRMMPYNEWTEVNSSVEGHFLERFAPGALAKTMAEHAARIRVLFEHGYDRLGRAPIATINGFDERDDGAYYEAALFRSVPALLLEGLRNGVYGSSIRFKPIKWDRVRSPSPSEHNPDGLPEHTIREAAVREFSVVTFPQYEGATASVRSLTDEIAARQLLSDPDRLLQIIRAADLNNASTEKVDDPETQEANTEPPHSEPAPQASRRTQRDYLQPQEGAPKWRL